MCGWVIAIRGYIAYLKSCLRFHQVVFVYIFTFQQRHEYVIMLLFCYFHYCTVVVKLYWLGSIPGFLFLCSFCEVFQSSSAISKFLFYPSLDKCHRQSQIFPVSFADFCRIRSLGTIYPNHFLGKRSF